MEETPTEEAPQSRLRDAFRLMRIPFSIYLMPVYWFAFSCATDFIAKEAFNVFFVLHFLLYPASNGYNSYSDQDEESVGGLENPPRVPPELLWLVAFFDLAAIMYAFYVSVPFAFFVTVYLMISKAYSYQKIRLKKNPLTSTLTVTLIQGAFTYYMVQTGLRMRVEDILSPLNAAYAFVATLLVCGSYPLTQIYQHKADRERGDTTLSMVLGIRGTFTFSKVSFALATILLCALYAIEGTHSSIIILLVCLSPVVYFFLKWENKVRKNEAEANFENTMRMNTVSSLSVSAAFILILIARNFA